MNNNDFEFPQLDKLVDWFIKTFFYDTFDNELAVVDKPSFEAELQLFIESIVADTVKIVSKDNK